MDSSIKDFFFENEENLNLIKDDDIVFLIAIQILRGLSYLFSRRITHRDIKLENIMINSSTYEIKLIDLNAGKFVIGNEQNATIIHSESKKRMWIKF